MINKELLKIIDKAAKDGVAELDLSGRRLTTLPPEIGRLTNLKVLKLHKNRLQKLPPEIGCLTNLEKLFLDENHLQELPPEIGCLTNLKTLLLSDNHLQELPPEIGCLTNLTELFLDENHLQELPPEIGRLTNLIELLLDENHLQELPPEIGCLTNLKTLLLSKNHLQELPPEISRLTHLEDLNLSENYLQELPPEISWLTHLTWLSLDENQIQEIPSEIGFLTNLTSLLLRNNHLQKLPSEIGCLTNLTELLLDKNHLQELPSEIGCLTNLTWLLLRNNHLQELPPEIGCLTNLTKLALSNNQLQELPPEIGRLTNLTELFLDDNRLTAPPPEIFNQGIKATLTYLRERLHTELQPQWISKLIIVGEGGVGKTVLLESLCNQPFNQQQTTTHGIEIRTLKLPHPSQTEVTMQLNTWDFGGQEIYHATHQFFLTNRSLFLLAWNARHGYEQGKLYYWLDTIQSLAPDSPILLIATHIDERNAQLPLTELHHKYPQIVEHWEVSSKTGQGIENLRQSITETAAKLPLMGELWPQTWLNAANAIRNLPEKYISPQQLKKLIIAEGVSPDSVEILAKFLHDLGDILYYNSDSDSRFLEEVGTLSNDIVIIKPQWVTEYISKVLENQDVINKFGIFTRACMAELWQDLEPYAREQFLRLMERFDLSYRIPDDGISTYKDASLIVERLPLDPPNYQQQWDTIKADSNCQEMSVKWKLNTISAGIPTWFIARSHRFSTGIHWRNGALFTDTDQKHLALVQAFPQERYLQLTVRGANPQNFFALLKDGIELTLKRFPGLEIKRMIPCPGANYQPCSHEFNYQKLQEKYEQKKTTIPCAECDENLSLIKLLFGLDFTPPTVAISPVETFSNVLLSRLDELQANIAQGQNNLQSEVIELVALIQREFLQSYRREKAKLESYCPSIFVLRPRDKKMWQKAMFGQKFDLKLYCEAPGCLHPTQDGGLYEIDDPAQWLKTTAPYLSKLVKILRLATPLIGPWVRVFNPEDYQTLFKNDMEMMAQLAKELPQIEGAENLEVAGSGNDDLDLERLQGAALRALHKLLEEKDPPKYWGGLKQVLTPEGHYLWLCEYHAQQYR